jgi:hypothetical protein
VPFKCIGASEGVELAAVRCLLQERLVIKPRLAGGDPLDGIDLVGTQIEQEVLLERQQSVKDLPGRVLIGPQKPPTANLDRKIQLQPEILGGWCGRGLKTGRRIRRGLICQSAAECVRSGGIRATLRCARGHRRAASSQGGLNDFLRTDGGDLGWSSQSGLLAFRRRGPAGGQCSNG